MYLEHRHSIKEKTAWVIKMKKIKPKTVLENSHLQKDVKRQAGEKTCTGSRPGWVARTSASYYFRSCHIKLPASILYITFLYLFFF